MRNLFILILFIWCYGIWAQVHINTGFPIKQVQANAGDDKQITVGSSVQIGASSPASFGFPGYTYLWQPATGLNSTTAQNPFASPSSTITYVLVVTDSKGCSDSDTMKVIVTNITNIEEVFSVEDVEIAQDRVKELLSITINPSYEITGQRLRLYNLIGQKIYDEMLPKILGKHILHVPLTGITKGVYILKLEGKSVNICKKFSVN